MLKCQENILKFITCKGSSFQNILYQRAVYHLQDEIPEGDSSTITNLK